MQSRAYGTILISRMIVMNYENLLFGRMRMFAMKTFLTKIYNWFYDYWEILLMFVLFAADVWFIYILGNDCFPYWLQQLIVR